LLPSLNETTPDVLNLSSLCVGHAYQIVRTTEALKDKLTDCIICKNNRGKYLNKAVAVLYDWYSIENEPHEGEAEEAEGTEGHQNHVFKFQIGDILEANCKEEGLDVICEFFELIDREHAESTFDSVLRETVRRLFQLISASWFYESAANEITVELTP
jgi:hypothetical protein